MIEEMKARNQQDLESLQLVGIETQEDNAGNYGVFKYQLSNGKRAVLANNSYKMKLFMLDLAGKSVRKVEIYHSPCSCLFGLKFFDQNLALILEVGKCTGSIKELILEENERIVGFVANKGNNEHSDYYNDF